MKKYLQFKDDVSDKFWWIEVLGAEFVVNYGKTGAIGKYQIKDCDDHESCLKEAKKQVAAKLKKGYVESIFDFADHFYIDDEEWGLHVLTSHPSFVKNFTEEFYFDCVEEEAPFGSDEGADALAQIGDLIRKNKDLDFSNFPEYLVNNLWGMTYLHVESLNEVDVKEIVDSDLKYDLTQSDLVTYSTAFAQIKIIGRLNKGLKERAIMAIKRTSVVGRLEGWGSEDGEIARQMIQDLESFHAIDQKI